MRRYAIGIDLGTTNCTLAYVDREAAEPGIEVFPIVQVTKPGLCEGRTTLPSFVYISRPGEFPEGSMALPWREDSSTLVGAFARDHGAKIPKRLISSAKSWLCHGGVDREAPILPQGGDPDICISPVRAAELLIHHMRNAWDHTFGGEEGSRLRDQDVVVTVPASFDPIARELTRKAIEASGLRGVTLLEEPQAALYAWLFSRGDSWREEVSVGDEILVCDVGGGTSDFSQIRVQEVDGNLELERVAVGEHILLGGDNMDIALAHVAVGRLKEQGVALDPWQSRELWYRCRDAKESLLKDPHLESYTVSVLGRGSGLVAGTLSTSLTRADIAAVVMKGFLPACEAHEGPRTRPMGGLRQRGLPYAQDPAITRHLCGFTQRHNRGEGGRANCILFNGGVFSAEPLRKRVQHVMGSWHAAGEAPALLEAGDMDHAVAIGAAYFGQVRSGNGVRIKGGTAASYYVGVESAMPAIPGFEAPLEALCIAPFGMEEGTKLALDTEALSLVVGEPALFRFLRSTSRKEDDLGVLVNGLGGDLEELPRLEMTLEGEGLEAGAFVPVHLETAVTEIGTLEVWCNEVAGEGRWKLEFNLRGSDGVNE